MSVQNDVLYGDLETAYLFEDKKKNLPKEIIDLMSNNLVSPQKNEIYDGVYIGQTKDDFLIDCGFKDYVRVPMNKNEKLYFEGDDKISPLTLGSTIGVLITDINNGSYTISGSVSATHRQDAANILGSIQADEYVMARIVELTSAGYNCVINMEHLEVPAFLPQFLAGVNKIPDDKRDDLVGQTLEMCVESFSSEKGTWILSRRKYLNLLKPRFIAELSTNTEYVGTVTGHTEFGIFVEFNECLTGMIHHSNISDELKVNGWENIEDGTEITFKVKEVIKETKIILTQVDRVSLWDTIAKGSTITGTVREHKKFGTLVMLDSETVGLIHLSVSTPRITDMAIGATIEVSVIDVDRSNRKIYLKPIK